MGLRLILRQWRMSLKFMFLTLFQIGPKQINKIYMFKKILIQSNRLKDVLIDIRKFGTPTQLISVYVW